MKSNTTLAIFAVLAAMALIGATATYVIQIIPVDAQNGVPFEKNFGQCKQDKNRNACENQK